MTKDESAIVDILANGVGYCKQQFVLELDTKALAPLLAKWKERYIKVKVPAPPILQINSPEDAFTTFVHSLALKTSPAEQRTDLTLGIKVPYSIADLVMTAAKNGRQIRMTIEEAI